MMESMDILKKIVGAGLAKMALPPFLKIIEEPMERKADESWFVMGGYKVADLTRTDKIKSRNTAGSISAARNEGTSL